ncbi:unnamed protein product [Schistosoma rodhaini]|nr:unnamed protein product [Schistosoma rodhaini]
MSDQQSHIRKLIEKKFSIFCAKESIGCDFKFSSEMVFITDWTDALLYLCPKLPNTKLQLAFLDFCLRTAPLLDEKAMGQIIEYLLRVFKDTTKDSCVEGRHYDSVLSSCAKLMVYCLTHSHAPSNSYILFMEAIDQIKSIISSSNVECLIGYAILFINIVKLERQNYLTEILNVLNQSENSSSSDITGNLFFLFQLFHSNKPQGQLAILLALVGIISTTDWFCNYKNYGSISLYILSMAGFSVDPNDHLLRKFDRNDSVTNLLHSKIVYSWSKKNLLNPCENSLEKNIKQFDVFTNPVLTYCIDMRGNYIDAIRYSASDTIENIIFYHLKYCDECRQPRISDNKSKISCGYLNEILNQLVSDSCYSRGTIAMLTRFIRCLSKKRVYRTINLLHSLDSVFQPLVNDANLEICGRVVSGLMRIADDPSLASEISEFYTLITQNLYIENDPLINVWLSGLVDTFIRNSNETFHSTVIQNILPSLVKTNPKLLELLVKRCNNDSGTVKMDTDLPTFLLTCYHLLSLNGMKLDYCEYLSLNFLKACLGLYDNQLRLLALNVLVSLITKSEQKMILSNEKSEMFLNYLRHDLWPDSKRIHGQIVSAIKDILLHTLLLMKRETNTTKLDDVKSFHVKLVHILMTCVYPGSPASRLSLGLAGLYTVVECFYSVFHTDGYSEFTAQIMGCLIEAAEKLHRISSFNDENFKLIGCSTSELLPLLFTGLCSRYDVDRDYVLKILLRLGILKQLNPNYINKLWTDALEIYAQSSKPDVSPIAGDILRFLIYGNENVDESNQLPSSSSSVDEKAIQAIDFLLNQLQEQIAICEKLPVIGLMSVVTNKPFYAILSTIHSVIGVTSLSSPLSKKNKPTDTQTWSSASIKAESLFKQINGVNVIERIISLGLRISEIVLPVVGHESPEGVLLTSQEDVINDIKTADEEAYQLNKFYEKTRNHPEYLILCCWRSVRELSLLMGISLVSYGLNKSDSNQMKPKEIFSIARFFCTQLLCCRHRGAFELCATGFTNFCTALVNHSVYFTIPIHWLNAITDQTLSLNEKSTNDCSTVIENIDFSLESCMGKHNTMECITRRGAGYPLFVQAILCADITRNTNVPTTTLTNTVCWLLKSVKTSLCNSDLQQSNNLSKCVLHLNIIRGIFQSKNLNCHTDKYLQKALIVALDGVGCRDLSIRNASILFYSTIVQRIFGVNRSKAVKSRKNCLATSTFFKRYPKFEHYLVEALTWYSTNTKFHSIPHSSSFKLYSILHLMTHLLPSTQVAVIDKTLYRLLIWCGFNDDIRIRKISSLALTSIIHPSVIMTTINHLFDLMELVHESILVKRWCNIRLNILHGLLLQIYALIYCNMDVHDSTPSVYTVPTISYLSKLNYLTVINRLKLSFSWLNDSAYITCTIIKQLYMKILNCHYDQPIQIETNVISLEYEYLITHINILIDCALNDSENLTLSTTNNKFYLDLMKWTKSMNSMDLLTVALRRIYSHLHSTIAHSTMDYDNPDIEDINEIINASKHLNSSIFNKLNTLFSFQTLFQNFIYQYFRLHENIPLNNNHKDDEVYRYAFALLTIQLQQQGSDHDSMNISNELILSAFQWSCKQIKFLFQKMKCLNSPPIYLAAFIRFHTELITVLYNDNSGIKLGSHVCMLCTLGNVCFDVLQHSHVCLEVKCAVLQSFRLSNIFIVRGLSYLGDDTRQVFLQTFDILIANITNLDSSKLRKLSCQIVQNILMLNDSKFQRVTQSPYILLDALIKLLLLHGDMIFYEHLLQFLRKKIRHFKELKSQLDNVISENAFSQTTLKFENDQLELIRIISDNITIWMQSRFHALYEMQHKGDMIEYWRNDVDQSLCRIIDFNEVVPFSIFKSDYVSLLYLYRFTDLRVVYLL